MATTVTAPPVVTLPSTGTTQWTSSQIVLSAEVAGTYLVWVA